MAKDGSELGDLGERAQDSVSASFYLKQFLNVSEQRGRLPALAELSV